MDYIKDLESQVSELTAQLAHERAVSAEWKRKARDARDKSHTWRLLYQDLLEKIGRKLDLKGSTPGRNHYDRFN